MEQSKYCDIQDNCKLILKLKNEIKILQECNELTTKKIQDIQYKSAVGSNRSYRDDCSSCSSSYKETIFNLKNRLENQNEFIENILKCLIKANAYGQIIDTLFYDEFSTLFDTIASNLHIQNLDKYMADYLSEIKNEQE